MNSINLMLKGGYSLNMIEIILSKLQFIEVLLGAKIARITFAFSYMVPFSQNNSVRKTMIIPI